MKKFLLLLFSFILHLVALGVVLYFWLPIARWYWSQIPARGIDLFNSVSYVSYLVKHFALPVNGWNYTWFSGVPLARDYPSGYFYLMVPFARYFGLVRGVQIFALTANFAFIGFAYLLFATLSKNRILAAILALASAYSVNVYRALVWAGGIPFFANQMMFPLVLYLVVKFLQKKNKRFLVLAALVSGLGLMGHPQAFINFIFPTVFILLAFYPRPKSKFVSWEKVKDLAVYIVATFFIGLPVLYYRIFEQILVPIAKIFNINLIGITPPQTEKTVSPEVAQWARDQFFHSFSGINQAFWHLLVLVLIFFILGLIVSKKRIRAFVRAFAVALVVGYVFFFVYLLSIGIDVYHGGWDAWYKMFWPVPVAIGALISQLWGVFDSSFLERIQDERRKFIFTALTQIVTGLVFVFLAFSLFSSYTEGVIKKIYEVSIFSSPFPEAVSARLYDEGLEQVKREVKPSFLEDNPGNYRLYCNDQTVNLWWNSVFSTPLARGYIDAPVGLKGRWGIFWMDAAFGPGDKGGTSLGDDWNTPEEVVEKNISYLLDWYAVGYLEGNHYAHGSGGTLPSVLTSDKFIEKEEKRDVSGAIQRDIIGKPEEGSWNEDLSQTINFYKVREELVSPIHQATNVPAVLLIGEESGFDVLTRFFAMMGFSSQKVILAAGPKFIDEVSLTQMLDFDAIILYKYDYKNYSKIWDRIAQYLEEGGRVFIDTGPEVKESSSQELPERFPRTLPEFFPIQQTKRSDLGNFWETKVGKVALFEGVEIEKFSDLQYENKPWNISYAPGGDADVRRNASVLLYSHGYPVIAEQEVGKGKIIWSGVNLPYHVLYNYNFEEGQLLVNIFDRLFKFGQDHESQSTLNWVSPQKRIIRSLGAKGVLVKEQIFPGWQAEIKAKSKKQKLNIYKVGPTSPGFMYVRIPEELRDQEVEVSFSYRGAIKDWLFNIISLLSMVLGMDYVCLKGKVILPIFSKAWSKLYQKVGSWWEKDEDE